MEDYKKKYLEALEKAKSYYNNEGSRVGMTPIELEEIFPELGENEDEKIRKQLIHYFQHIKPYVPPIKDCFGDEYGYEIPEFIAWLEKQAPSEKAIEYLAKNHSSSEISDFQAAMNIAVAKAYDKGYNDGLEKQGSEPNWCHHKVDLSNCSDEYRKAYYDGWNNCNMQHSQCRSDGNDIVKCLINGMKFYYKDNEDAMWGTDKFSMKVKDILSWLEKQGEQNPAWSEEDEANLNNIIWLCNNCINGSETTWIPLQATRIKSLIERIKDTVFLQSKQQWSEHKKLIKNDACVALTKKMLYDIILDLKVFRDKDCSAEGKEAYQREIDWLENLKKELGG